jgi:hypothetical protein
MTSDEREPRVVRSIREGARILGIPEATLRTRLGRVRKSGKQKGERGDQTQLLVGELPYGFGERLKRIELGLLRMEVLAERLERSVQRIASAIGVAEGDDDDPL